jgi:hypothetical protein
MMRASTRNPHPPGQSRRDEATDQRPDRSRDRAGRAHERVDLRPHLPFEVAVDQRLHGGQVERGAQAPDEGPEDDDRPDALRDHHRERAGRVEHQAYDVRALAPEEVPDLAADQDERG